MKFKATSVLEKYSLISQVYRNFLYGCCEEKISYSNHDGARRDHPLDNFSPLFSQIAILIWGYAFLNLIYISLMLSLLAERSFIQAEYRLKTV